MTQTTTYARPAIQNVSDEELLQDKQHNESLLTYYKYWSDETAFNKEMVAKERKLLLLQDEIMIAKRRHQEGPEKIKEFQKRLWNIEIELKHRSDERTKETVRKSTDAKKTKTREERIDEKYALLPEAFKTSMPLADVRKFIEDNML